MSEQLVIEGVVEDIVYSNAENGYTVINLSSDNTLITAVGIMPSCAPGEKLKLHGQWKMHPTFGTQFAAEVCERSMPESAGDMYIILRDATWLKYFGDYAFNADGESVDYAGITTEKLSNGYIRVTMILDELDRTGCNNNRDVAPETLAVFDVFGTTTVNGHIQNLQFLNEVPSRLLEKLVQNILRLKTELE